MLVIVNYCLTLNSYAMSLGEINNSGGGGGSVIVTGMEFAWSSDEGLTMYWEVVTPFDVGKTFHQSSATSENFDFFASMLTSGTDDFLWIASFFPGGGGSSNGAEESWWLNKFVPTQSVDFYGYEITDIALTVNALTIDSPGTNPNRDGVWTDYTFDVTYTIIPEPTTVLLLGLGGLALLRKRRA